MMTAWWKYAAVKIKKVKASKLPSLSAGKDRGSNGVLYLDVPLPECIGSKSFWSKYIDFRQA